MRISLNLLVFQLKCQDVSYNFLTSANYLVEEFYFLVNLEN